MVPCLLVVPKIDRRGPKLGREVAFNRLTRMIPGPTLCTCGPLASGRARSQDVTAQEGSQHNLLIAFFLSCVLPWYISFHARDTFYERQTTLVAAYQISGREYAL